VKYVAFTTPRIRRIFKVSNEVAKEDLKIPKLYSLSTKKEYLEYKREEKIRTSPHKSHRMSKWYSEILAPCGTPRFYAVRHCTKCGKEEQKHAAGHFFNGLKEACK